MFVYALSRLFVSAKLQQPPRLSAKIYLLGIKTLKIASSRGENVHLGVKIVKLGAKKVVVR